MATAKILALNNQCPMVFSVLLGEILTACGYWAKREKLTIKRKRNGVMRSRGKPLT